MITRAWASLLLAAGLVLSVAGCSSDDETSTAAASEGSELSAPAPTVSTPAAPTLEEQQIEWAGEVCIARDRLNEQVSSLGRNLEFDLGLDASVLDQLDRQLRLQVLAVASAANDLGMVLVTVPVDPVDANDWLLEFTDAQEELQTAVDTTTGHLDAMVSADGLVDGLAEGAAAVSSGVAAFEAGQALVAAAQDTFDQAQEEFAPAFEAAPECQGGDRPAADPPTADDVAAAGA